MSEDTVPYGTLTSTQLTNARLRIAHETLLEVLQDTDLLPPGAHEHLLEAVRQLLAARALSF